MSKEALAKVVQRAISDASFRRQLSSDTAGALRGFDLTPDEVSALRAGDAGRLSTLGVDQRMSKSFVLGGMAAATRMAQSDLTAGSPTAIDDGAAGVGRTIIPHDPESALNADLDGAGSSRAASVINDDPDGFLAANARASGGPGTWAGSTHELNEGSGGVTPQTIRTGDDWKYADRSTGSANAAPVEGSPEADAAAQARVDDASGASSGARAINDDPDGFLAANQNADFSGGTSRGDGTAFLDESEAYHTRVGYDPDSTTSAVTDAHDRGGEDSVTRIAPDDSDASGGTAASEDGPNISS
jgi:hypothetical protein